MKKLDHHLDIKEAARMLCDVFQDVLDKNYKPGIYLRGSYTPAFVPNKKYYAHNPDCQLELDLTDPAWVDKVNGSVVDENGLVVMSQSMIPLLSVRPTVLPAAVEIIKLYVDETITRSCAWANWQYSDEMVFFNKLLQHLDTSYAVEERYRQAQDILRNLDFLFFKEVNNHISGEAWGVYGLDISGYRLRISYLGDYRAERWQELKRVAEDIRSDLQAEKDRMGRDTERQILEYLLEEILDKK